MATSPVVVAVRVRPLSRREIASGTRVVITMESGQTLSVADPTALLAMEALRDRNGDQATAFTSNQWSRRFAFDHCFDSSSDPLDQSKRHDDQNSVFEALGTRVLESAWEGYNASLLAYGQTGAGKSYSMMGTGAVLDDRLEPKHYGLIPRIAFALFQSIAQAEAQADAGGLSQGPGTGPSPRSAGPRFGVEVSYMEIYNETVFDLFALGATGQGQGSSQGSSHGSMGRAKAVGKGPARLRVREHPTHGVYVQDLTVVAVNNYLEVGQLMSLGGRARTVAHTNMNESSSRSHAIFTITFKQAADQATDGAEKVSRIHMVDLAGSERVDQTGASGERLREAKNINRSLATLCDVVKALASQHDKELSQAESGHRGTGQSSVFGAGHTRPDGGAFSHVPYRNSVLTWLLKESLGGNSRTTMLAAVSPCASHFDETMSTLKYAERAKRMRTKAVVNARVSDEHLIAQLRREVAELRRELALRRSGSFDPTTNGPPTSKAQLGQAFAAVDDDALRIQRLNQQRKPSQFPPTDSSLRQPVAPERAQPTMGQQSSQRPPPGFSSGHPSGSDQHLAPAETGHRRLGGGPTAPLVAAASAASARSAGGTRSTRTKPKGTKQAMRRARRRAALLSPSGSSVGSNREGSAHLSPITEANDVDEDDCEPASPPKLQTGRRAFSDRPGEDDDDGSDDEGSDEEDNDGGSSFNVGSEEGSAQNQSSWAHDGDGSSFHGGSSFLSTSALESQLARLEDSLLSLDMSRELVPKQHKGAATDGKLADYYYDGQDKSLSAPVRSLSPDPQPHHTLGGGGGGGGGQSGVLPSIPSPPPQPRSSRLAPPPSEPPPAHPIGRRSSGSRDSWPQSLSREDIFPLQPLATPLAIPIAQRPNLLPTGAASETTAVSRSTVSGSASGASQSSASVLPVESSTSPLGPPSQTRPLPLDSAFDSAFDSALNSALGQRLQPPGAALTPSASFDASASSLDMHGGAGPGRSAAVAAAVALDRAAALQAMGVALLPGDAIDPKRPRLVNLNQDPLFSECLVYYVNDGVTLLGSDPHGDIQLSGPDMRPRHAVLTFTTPPTGGLSDGLSSDDGSSLASDVSGLGNGLIHLCPVDGAVAYVNGKLVSGDPYAPNDSDKARSGSASPGSARGSARSSGSLGMTRPVLLCHNARIVFGRHHVFRFEQPLAASRPLAEDVAQRRADRKADRRDKPFGAGSAVGLNPGLGSGLGSGLGADRGSVDVEVVSSGRSVESLEEALTEKLTSELLEEATDGPVTDAVLDWDFALRELMINSPDAPLVNPDGRSGSQRSSSHRSSRSSGSRGSSRGSSGHRHAGRRSSKLHHGLEDSYANSDGEGSGREGSRGGSVGTGGDGSPREGSAEGMPLEGSREGSSGSSDGGFGSDGAEWGRAAMMRQLATLAELETKVRQLEAERDAYISKDLVSKSTAADTLALASVQVQIDGPATPVRRSTSPLPPGLGTLSPANAALVATALALSPPRAASKRSSLSLSREAIELNSALVVASVLAMEAASGGGGLYCDEQGGDGGNDDGQTAPANSSQQLNGSSQVDGSMQPFSGSQSAESLNGSSTVVDYSLVERALAEARASRGRASRSALASNTAASKIMSSPKTEAKDEAETEVKAEAKATQAKVTELTATRAKAQSRRLAAAASAASGSSVDGNVDGSVDGNVEDRSGAGLSASDVEMVGSGVGRGVLVGGPSSSVLPSADFRLGLGGRSFASPTSAEIDVDRGGFGDNDGVLAATTEGIAGKGASGPNLSLNVSLSGLALGDIGDETFFHDASFARDDTRDDSADGDADYDDEVLMGDGNDRDAATDAGGDDSVSVLALAATVNEASADRSADASVDKDDGVCFSPSSAFTALSSRHAQQQQRLSTSALRSGQQMGQLTSLEALWRPEPGQAHSHDRGGGLDVSDWPDLNGLDLGPLTSPLASPLAPGRGVSTADASAAAALAHHDDASASYFSSASHFSRSVLSAASPASHSHSFAAGSANDTSALSPSRHDGSIRDNELTVELNKSQAETEQVATASEQSKRRLEAKSSQALALQERVNALMAATAAALGESPGPLVGPAAKAAAAKPRQPLPLVPMMAAATAPHSFGVMLDDDVGGSWDVSEEPGPMYSSPGAHSGAGY